MLNSVLDFILVDYDHQEKVHRLNINFKIPVIIRNHQKKRTNSNEFILTPSKTLVKSTDQLSSVENYSTVVGSSSMECNINQQKGYSLRLSVELTSSNLWTSPYSLYQQEVFDLIRKLHEQDGWNFKQISDWLNENGYKTPRDKVFKENHVWSIYMKKMKSMTRFSREFDHSITDMGVDVVDFVPSKG